MKDKKGGKHFLYFHKLFCEGRVFFDIVHMYLSYIGTWFIISCWGSFEAELKDLCVRYWIFCKGSRASWKNAG